MYDILLCVVNTKTNQNTFRTRQILCITTHCVTEMLKHAREHLQHQFYANEKKGSFSTCLK